MTVVQMPDGVNVDFGNLPPDQIKALILKKFPDAPQQAQAVTSQPDRGALEATANQWANQTLFGMGPQVGGIIQGVLDATGLDQHRGGVDRAAPGTQIPRTVADLNAQNEQPIAAPEGSFAGGYNRFVDNAYANLDREAQQHPVASAVGGIGGVLTTLPFAPEVAVGRAAQGAGLGARMIRGAETAGLYGGIYGAGNTRGDLGDRAVGGLEGAAIGAATGGIAPPILAGVGAGASALARPFRGAASRIGSAIAADLRTNPAAVTDWQAAQAGGAPVIGADIGETTRALARSAANTSPEGRAILNQALDARHELRADRAAQAFADAAPGVNAPQTRDLLQQAAAMANRPAYARAYMEGERGIWNEGLAQLTTADAVKQAIAGATRTGTNRAAVEGTRPPVNPFVRQPDGTLTLPPGVRPTLRFWDVVKQNLDSAIGKAQRAGDNPRFRDLTRLKSQLVSYLDEAVPSYRAARQGAAAYFGADNALEAGSNFATRTSDAAQEDARALARLNPAERRLFGEGFATTTINRIRENPNRIDAIRRSPAAMQRIELALGRNGFNRIEAFLRVERLMDMTRRGLQGNSTTARQLAELGLAGGIGAVSTGGSLSDPNTFIHAALAYGLLRGRRAIANRVDSHIAQQVAEMLASGDPAIIRQAINRIGQQPRLLNALKDGESHFSRVLGPILGPRGGSGAGLLQGGAVPAAASGQEEQPRQ